MSKTKLNYTTKGNELIPFEASKKPVKTKIYKGKRNQTDFPEFVDICKMTQVELKKVLPEKLLDAGYEDVVIGDGYVYAKGNFPVLLTAHMDTVHKEPVKDFYEHVDGKGHHIISSPQGIGGDDRCGIYMVLELIKTHKCSVLFCEDEEIGGVGSKKFCKTDLITELENMNYLVELDRRGSDDAVYYNCANKDFIQFVEKATGYKESWGSFSDISTLAPMCKVAAVNLSCGYHNAHTTDEEVNVEEMLNTIEAVKKLLNTECEQFEYVEDRWTKHWRDYDYDDYDYYGYYGTGYGGYNYGTKNYNRYTVSLYIEYEDETGEADYDVIMGADKNECWATFFLTHPSICYDQILDFYVDYIDY